MTLVYLTKSAMCMSSCLLDTCLLDMAMCMSSCLLDTCLLDKVVYLSTWQSPLTTTTSFHNNNCKWLCVCQVDNDSVCQVDMCMSTRQHIAIYSTHTHTKGLCSFDIWIAMYTTHYLNPVEGTLWSGTAHTPKDLSTWHIHSHLQYTYEGMHKRNIFPLWGSIVDSHSVLQCGAVWCSALHS